MRGINTSQHDRGLLAIAYRPAWAGPIAEVPDWPPEKVAQLPIPVRRLFGSLNTRKIDYHVGNSSSSLMRSRIGPTWRCTYFLLANGCVTRFARLGSSPSNYRVVCLRKGHTISPLRPF